MRRLTAILLIVAAGTLAAQEKPATTTTAPATTSTTAVATTTAPPAATFTDSTQIRDDLSSVIRKYPTELSKILAIDPSLLSNDAFLAAYPGLAEFVAAHPEVRQHPSFYLSQFEFAPRRQQTMLDQILEMLGVGFIFVLVVFSFGWLVRAIVDQRRWSRLAKTQNEVHNKILDRFGTSTELLEYMKTPAGSKFLESAPIPLHSEAPAPNAPLARVLWSVQIGVVVAAAAVGMLIVSGRFEKETAEGFFTLGMIGLSIGLGFIASAVVSLFVSRRLGLWSSPSDNEAELVK